MFHPWRNEETALLIMTSRVFAMHTRSRISSNFQRTSYNRFWNPKFRALAVPEQTGDIYVFQEANNIEEEAVRLIKLPPLILEDDLLAMVQSLNSKQGILCSCNAQCQ